MAQEDKTKEELIEEIKLLQKRIAELEKLYSERKKAEEVLRESGWQWNATFDAISNSVCLIDSDGKILKCNQATERLLGKSAGELNGQFCYKVVHGYSQPIPDCPIEQMKKTKRRESKILQLGDRWLEVITDPILDKDQRVLAAVHIIQDITERKKAEEALRESQERYWALMDNTVLGVTVIDTNYKIIMANTILVKLFNKPASDFVGKNCFREYEKREAVCPHCPGVRAMASGKTEEVETQGVRDDGSRIYVRNRAIPFFGPGGVVKGFIEMVEDIDARKKMEEENSKHLQELKVFYKASVGREERILELKKEVEELKKKIKKLESKLG